MDKHQISRLTAGFDQISHKTEDGVEFWYARELQPILGYARWENFANIIEKASDRNDYSLYNVTEVTHAFSGKSLAGYSFS